MVATKSIENLRASRKVLLSAVVLSGEVCHATRVNPVSGALGTMPVDAEESKGLLARQFYYQIAYDQEAAAPGGLAFYVWRRKGGLECVGRKCQ